MMEVGMEGEAGFLTGVKQQSLRPMIELTKNIETGYESL